MAHDDPKQLRCDGAGNPGHAVGITGLTLLAFLADGHTTKSGTYQSKVAGATKWLKTRHEIRASEVYSRLPARASGRSARLERFIKEFEGTYAARVAEHELNRLRR